MSRAPYTYTYTVTHAITARKISDLLITAIEGGCGYWMSNFTLIRGEEPADRPWYASDNIYEKPFRIKIEVIGDSVEHWLTPFNIQDGINLMARDYEEHFTNWMNGDDDAVTADVFLQLAVFGDIVYG